MSLHALKIDYCKEDICDWLCYFPELNKDELLAGFGHPNSRGNSLYESQLYRIQVSSDKSMSMAQGVCTFIVSGNSSK